MIGVKHQCVARLEGERVLVFLFCKDIISGAELLDGGIVQTSTFLHLGCNEESFTFDLSHFRLDVSSASDSERICRNVTGVKTEHSGDSIPEGGLTIASITVGNDECLHIDLADSSQTTNHLNIIDEFLITLKDEVKAVQPNLLALVVR